VVNRDASMQIVIRNRHRLWTSSQFPRSVEAEPVAPRTAGREGNS